MSGTTPTALKHVMQLCGCSGAPLYLLSAHMDGIVAVLHHHIKTSGHYLADLIAMPAFVEFVEKIYGKNWKRGVLKEVIKQMTKAIEGRIPNIGNIMTRSTMKFHVFFSGCYSLTLNLFFPFLILLQRSISLWFFQKQFATQPFLLLSQSTLHSNSNNNHPSYQWPKMMSLSFFNVTCLHTTTHNYSKHEH